jgi:hypothetical protein
VYRALERLKGKFRYGARSGEMLGCMYPHRKISVQSVERTVGVQATPLEVLVYRAWSVERTIGVQVTPLEVLVYRAWTRGPVKFSGI